VRKRYPFRDSRRRRHMPEIDDLIREVIGSNASADDKTKIIQALTAAAPADRWGVNRFVVWGLIGVVVVTVVGVVIAWGRATGNPTNFTVPEGLIALATTALGALAAYLVPPGHPVAAALSTPAERSAPGPAPALNPVPALAPARLGVNASRGPASVPAQSATGGSAIGMGMAPPT
jgi:hypothetical protein